METSTNLSVSNDASQGQGNCGIGQGGFQPGNTCAVGGSGRTSNKPEPKPGDRHAAKIQGKLVTLKRLDDDADEVVEGPKELLGQRFRKKAKPAATAQEPPKKEEPKEPSKTNKPDKPQPLKSIEEAEERFSTAHKTNLKKGRGVSDAEFLNQAEHVASEMTRMSSEFKIVADTIKKRGNREQRLELGTDFGDNTGGKYKYGEGIELAPARIDNTAAPKFGQHTVGDDLGSHFRHELGHEVYNVTFSRAKQNDWGKVVEPHLNNSSVSRYGGTNASELFSESFAAYTNKNYKRGSLPPAVEEWLDKNVKG